MALLLAAGAVCLTLITPMYIIYKPPALLIRYFQRRWPDVIWHVPTTKKIVALTIDDGPSKYTQEIMHILKANNVSATFFIIGSQVPGHEETLEELIRNGNELANHAMHDEPSANLTDGNLAQQIMTVQTMLASAYHGAGVAQPAVRFFRPGHAWFSARMRALLAKMEYRMVLANIYPHDPFVSSWRVNASHILSMVQPGGVILCHDRRPWTAPMLQKVLPELKRRGYQVVTVTKLLEEVKT